MSSPQIVFQAESNLSEINPNYFCTDQTNMNQENTSRNFYDSAKTNIYLPNTDIVIGNMLYSSVNCQDSVDFSVIFQSVNMSLNVNYDNIQGVLSFGYTVVDDEYVNNPVVSSVSNVSKSFINEINSKVYITRSPTNPDRILYILYK